MNAAALKELIERIINGTATDEDIRYYNRLFNSFQRETEQWDERLLGKKEEIAAAIKDSMLRQAGIPTLVIPPGKKRLTALRWAVAASILLLLGGFGWWYTAGKERKTEVQLFSRGDRLRTEAVPGQTGAILTLSDGRMIVLDSADNGSLTLQGNTEVRKENGRLLYSNNEAFDAGTVYNTMTTPRGNQYSLVLSDGTKVWLNAASSITYPVAFSGKERRVQITGEAYFEVAHEVQRPFTVSSGETSIQVLGTHFNVNAYDDENTMNVTLLEGLVSVAKGDRRMLIKPGQQAQITEQAIMLADIPNLNEVIAWKNRTFSADGVTIESLMRQIARWYDVEIVYSGKVNELFYLEMPYNSRLPDILKVLELSGNIHFRTEGKIITVNP